MWFSLRLSPFLMEKLIERLRYLERTGEAV